MPRLNRPTSTTVANGVRMCSVSFLLQFITKCLHLETEMELLTHLAGAHQELKAAEEAAAANHSAESSAEFAGQSDEPHLTCPLCQQACASSRAQLAEHLSAVSCDDFAVIFTALCNCCAAQNTDWHGGVLWENSLQLKCSDAL